MAQRVNVVLVDDLDGSDAAETVSFGLDGVSYDIDLSTKNAGKLRDALSVYVGHARRSEGRSSGGRRRGRGRSARTAGGPEASEIRAWARKNGWDIPDRGRVAAEVRKAYDAAH
jgi:hypothetical protein